MIFVDDVCDLKSLLQSTGLETERYESPTPGGVVDDLSIDRGCCTNSKRVIKVIFLSEGNRIRGI
jgi:hypothetical protein